MLNSRCRLVGKQQIAASVGVGNADVVGPTIAVVADDIFIEEVQRKDREIWPLNWQQIVSAER